jgi:hypothetical protein
MPAPCHRVLSKLQCCTVRSSLLPSRSYPWRKCRSTFALSPFSWELTRASAHPSKPPPVSVVCHTRWQTRGATTPSNPSVAFCLGSPLGEAVATAKFPPAATAMTPSVRATTVYHIASFLLAWGGPDPTWCPPLCRTRPPPPLRPLPRKPSPSVSFSPLRCQVTWVSPVGSDLPDTLAWPLTLPAVFSSVTEAALAAAVPPALRARRLRRKHAPMSWRPAGKALALGPKGAGPPGQLHCGHGPGHTCSRALAVGQFRPDRPWSLFLCFWIIFEYIQMIQFVQNS